MRVRFDPQTFLRQRTGGISRLFTDLILQFHRSPSLGIQLDLPFRWVNNRYAAQDLASLGLRGTPSWLPREVLYALWLIHPTRPRRACDVLHHTYYSGRFLTDSGSRYRVCTVYDMIPEIYSGTELFTGSHLSKRDYVLASDLVICISQSTRNDLVEQFGSLAGRVIVIPSAVGPGFAPGLPRVAGLPLDYLLYVGGRQGYKDFSLLPFAMRELADDGLSVPVVVVGAPFSRNEERSLADLGVSHLFTRVPLADRELRCAYANATAVVQTSRYEGFGMTPLEGMASGVPVVIANSSAMPEVGGEVARYFIAGDSTSLAEALALLLFDDNLRAELGVRGVARASQFTSQLMAERTARAYSEIMGS